MKTAGGLLAFAYALIMIAAGFNSAPFWVPLVGALAAVGIYLMIRHQATHLMQQYWNEIQVGAIIKFAIELYISQLVPASIMYGVGFGVGWLISSS